MVTNEPFSYFETEGASFRKYWSSNPRVWDWQSIILKISKIMTWFFSKFHRSCLHPSSLDPFAIITGIGGRKIGLNIFFALGRGVNHRPLKRIARRINKHFFFGLTCLKFLCVSFNQSKARICIHSKSTAIFPISNQKKNLGCTGKDFFQSVTAWSIHKPRGQLRGREG